LLGCFLLKLRIRPQSGTAPTQFQRCCWNMTTCTSLRWAIDGLSPCIPLPGGLRWEINGKC
jgi:hypothetical protein